MAFVFHMLLAANTPTSGTMLSKRDSMGKLPITMWTFLSQHSLSNIQKMEQITALFTLSISTPPLLKTAKSLLEPCSGNLSLAFSLPTPTFHPSCHLSPSTHRATLMFCQVSTSEVQHQAQPQLIPSQSSQSLQSLFHHQETTFPLFK